MAPPRRLYRGPGGRAWPVLLVALACGGWPQDAAAAGPLMAKGPYLTGLSAVGVEVRFELDAAAPATVEVSGAGGGTPRTVADGSAATHVVHVTGLEPGQAYEYVVRAGGAALGKGHFVTAPKDDAAAPVKFLLYGDDRSDQTAHASLVHALLETPSDFLVNTGDIVADGGSAEDWQAFFRIEQPLLRDRALFLSIGNHELYDDRSGSNFARYFGYADASGAPQPFGTTRWGSIRFFFLNGMHDWQGGTERQWLENALKAADAEPGLVWRIAVVHHSPWSSGPHGGNAKLQDAGVPQLLGAHGVDLLLAGHDHIYERGDGGRLKYVISGGGGAPLYALERPQATTRKAESTFHFVEMTARGDVMHLVAHRLDGSILESCAFTKGHPWDCDAPPKSVAPAGSPASVPPETPAGSSRCACSVPGAPAGSTAAWLLTLAATGAGLAGVARRRRG